MRAALVYIFLLWFGFLLQTTVVQYVFHGLARGTGWTLFENQTIELSFIVLAYLALHREILSAVSWSIVLGIMAGWFGLSWPGCLAIAYFVTTLACMSSRKNVLITSTGSIMLFMFILTLIQGFVQFQTVSWIHDARGVFGANFGIWMMQSILNALAAPLIFETLRKVDDMIGVSGYAGSRQNLIRV